MSEILSDDVINFAAKKEVDINPLPPKITFEKNAIFPSSLCKGTFDERNKFAEKLHDKFITNLKKHLDKKEKLCDETIRKAFDESIPVPINYDIIQLNEKAKQGAMSPIFDATINYSAKNSFDYNYVGYNLEFSKKNVCTVSHEFRHLLDFLCNPKFGKQNIKSPLKSSIMKDEYLNNIYVLDPIFKTEIFKQRLKKLLDNREIELQKDLIRSWRYNLITELNAHKSSIKAIENCTKNPIKRCIDKTSIKLAIKYYRFEEKIKIISELLSETRTKSL